MDKFRCAKLVLDSLHFFNDIVMNRMSVAICSILGNYLLIYVNIFIINKTQHQPLYFVAAKISTSETSQLGSNPRYMSKLLAIVRDKLATRTVDVTMKFTLSALWNLTGKNVIRLIISRYLQELHFIE